MTEKRNLPTIQELYSDKLALAKQNDLNILLNQDPKKDWLKQHPILKNVTYIPIERIEWLLTNLFIKWRVEVKDYKLIANSVCSHIRLHYLDPVTNEWDWTDGLGAAPLQTDKDAGATDFNKIKSDAVMKALPASESYAVKDAAEKIGKLFGKDMNRADQIMYDSLVGKFENYDEVERLKIVLSEFDSWEELDKKKISLREEYKAKGVKSAQQIIESRLNELKNANS